MSTNKSKPILEHAKDVPKRGQELAVMPLSIQLTCVAPSAPTVWPMAYEYAIRSEPLTLPPIIPHMTAAA
jgi:hypothetical protein